jgi:hypothetical protein
LNDQDDDNHIQPRIDKTYWPIEIELVEYQVDGKVSGFSVQSLCGSFFFLAPETLKGTQNPWFFQPGTMQ